MMRLGFGLIILSFVFTACTPAEDAGTVVDQGNGNGAEATQEASPEAFIIVTRNAEEEATSEGALAIPAPGELVASETEDPEASLVFDRLTLVRTGTVQGNNIRDDIELYQNGQYTRNGISGVAPPTTITRIDDLIDAVNFYGMQGTLLGPSTDNDAYLYRLTVERNGLERSIQSQDGFMPVEYITLLGEILLVGMQ